MVLDLTPLKGIPKYILPEDISSVQIVKGGLNNRNILLNNSNLLKEYLQRDEKNDPVRLRYFREKNAFTRLLNTDFMPNLFKTYEVEEKFFLTRSWIEGTIMTINDLEFNLEYLVSTLSTLHKQQYSCDEDYHYFAVIERYIREYRKYTYSQEWDFPDYTSIDSFYEDRSGSLEGSEGLNTLTRIHGDLVFSNIIKSGQKCILIDWEYTTRGEPLIDLAYLVTQNAISSTLENKLLNAYMEHSKLEIDLNLFSSYKDLMNLMSALWYALQVFRLQNNIPIHSDIDTSNTNFQELANQSFKKLEIR
ncbi:MAG: phosphotransferase family protein [Candidatus Hodarchaeales archaeon]|jgi:thiamine kinase-like enzyme